MANPHRSHFSLSTKIALAIIVVVGIVGFLYYDPTGLDIFSSGGLGSIGSGLTNIFGDGGSGERLNFTMTSSVSLFQDELSLEGATVTARGTHLADTSVGDLVFENNGKESEISFVDFNGKMEIADGILTISGSAGRASSDGSAIRPKSKTFEVAAQLTPSSYSINPVAIEKISLSGVSGSIERLGDESSTTQLSNSTVEIVDFQGSLSLNGANYIITGSASEIKGKSFTLKG